MAEYTIKAIPTIYSGIRFRSRLEARWAAFFDLSGWRWEYEPFDLEGWTPDFVLIGDDGNTVLVEVKPFFWREGRFGWISTDPKDDQSLDKVFQNLPSAPPEEGDCGWRFGNETVVLGAHIARVNHQDFIGLFIGRDSWGHREADPASLYRGHKYQLDFAATEGSYRYRMGGEYDGDHHLVLLDAGDAQSSWAKAGNMVQWRNDIRS